MRGVKNATENLPEDETLVIETPEHVELHFALASLGNRFLACLIDHALQVGTLAVIFIVSAALSAQLRELSRQAADGAAEANLWVMAGVILAGFVINFGYFTFFETFWSGRTPGKRWLRLRVIKDDGRPVNFFAAFTRNMLRTADFFPALYAVGTVSVFLSGRAKRLGDFVAGTVVVKERPEEAPSFAELFEGTSQNGGAGGVVDRARRRVAPPVNFVCDMRLVTPAEMEVVEAYLRRRFTLPPSPRQWMAWRVAYPILERMRPQFDPAAFNYEGFLEELLARYRGRVN
jgi:uncharacterized RDD family membrane protein YckC